MWEDCISEGRLASLPFVRLPLILVLAAAIITGLRLARDPRAGSQTERVINAVEDGHLFRQIYAKALLRFGQGNIHASLMTSGFEYAPSGIK